MRFGFIYPGSDPLVAVELAAAAEAAGWDGFFLSESVWATDPWSTLAAASVGTERIRLGTMLTPVPKRRPWELADQTRTVDRLSGGRVVLAAGLGVPQHLEPRFWLFDDDPGRRERVELLDEGLELLERLWGGEAFEFEGAHHRARRAEMWVPPPSVQRPRIPVWVVGAWPRPRSMRRVARWDGWLPNFIPPGTELATPEDQAGFTPEHLAEGVAWLRAVRERLGRGDAAFDVIQEGTTAGADAAADAAIVRPWRDAGATWWLDTDWSVPAERVDEWARARVAAGPPRVD